MGKLKRKSGKRFLFPQHGLMAMRHWTLDNIPWDKFDRSKVDPDLLRIVKATAMVEANGGDYGTYLCRVFHDDPEFQQVAQEWAVEEMQHGSALGRWAMLADPSFDYDESFRRFTAGYKIELDVEKSIRGSRAGELVARCIVETGTSTYYTALKEAAEEPVLKEICRNIAADEFRHYKLFYTHLKRYLDREKLGAWGRIRVALRRLIESEDDELAYAYYAANHPGETYDRRRCSREYARAAYPLYRRPHVERGIAMVLKAIGLSPTGRLSRWLANFAFRFLRFRADRLNTRALNSGDLNAA
ncbi:MAG TPA: ferritin-like domain-containing protein [Dongiaceae bacterium]